MLAEKREEPKCRVGGRTQCWSSYCPGFSLQDAQGLVDFRDVALALAALDGGRSLDELTRLAFEVSGWGRGGTCVGHAYPTQRPLWGAASSSF